MENIVIEYECKNVSRLHEAGGYMSYEMLIERIKTLPEQLLIPIAAFIKFLEAEQCRKEEMKMPPKTKQNFFELAGKIHLDRNSVTELREASLL